jgi:hypothetical protein
VSTVRLPIHEIRDPPEKVFASFLKKEALVFICPCWKKGTKKRWRFRRSPRRTCGWPMSQVYGG